MFRKLVPLLGLAGASAHAAMSLPPPRTMHGKPIECYNKSSGEVCNAGCSHSSCLWYQVGCMVGCDECSLEGKGMYPTPHDVQCKRGGAPVPKGSSRPEMRATWLVYPSSDVTCNFYVYF